MIVNIYVKNDDVLNSPVQGVVVAIYNMSSVFVTQQTSDSLGLASVSLPTGNYRVYAFKLGFSILQPQLLTVPIATSIDYELIGHIRELPESLDPKTIRVSGYLTDSSNRAKKNHTLQFFHDYTLVVDETVVSNIPVTYMSDEKGYFQFDLMRKQKYKHDYLLEQELCNIETPDLPAIELPNLIFPIPQLLTFSSTTINLPLSGGPIDVPYTCTFTDYSTDRGMRSDWGWVMSTVTPDEIIGYGIGKEVITITPLALGTTSITFSRQLRKGFVWDDAPTFTSPILTVNVT